MSFLIKKRSCSFKKKKATKSSRSCSSLKKEKNKKLDQELAQSKGTISSLKSSSGTLQDSYDILQKTHKDL
jgi:hypothetical protein